DQHETISRVDDGALEARLVRDVPEIELLRQLDVTRAAGAERCAEVDLVRPSVDAFIVERAENASVPLDDPQRVWALLQGKIRCGCRRCLAIVRSRPRTAEAVREASDPRADDASHEFDGPHVVSGPVRIE